MTAPPDIRIDVYSHTHVVVSGSHSGATTRLEQHLEQCGMRIVRIDGHVHVNAPWRDVLTCLAKSDVEIGPLGPEQ
jgi:hypothetical protein